MEQSRPGPRRWVVALAWLVILGTVAAAAVRVALVRERPATAPGPDPRHVIAVRMALAFESPEMRRAQLGELRSRPAGALHAAVLAAEADGPAAARAVLEEDAPPESLTEPQRRARSALLRVYGEPADGVAERVRALEAGDREALETALGATARLVLHPDPADPVRRRYLRGARLAVAASFGILGLACVAVVGGGAAWLVWLVALRRPFVLRGEAAPVADARLVVAAAAMFGGWIALSLLRSGPLSGLPAFGVLPATIALSVMALPVAWLLLTSPDRAATRAAIGWTRGRGLVREAGAALAAVPVHVLLIAAGLAVTAALTRVAGQDLGSLGHPAAQAAPTLSASALAGMLFHGCVAAPLFEETLFRGLLYPSLRAATSGWGRAASVLAAGAAQAVLFAAVHPQGMLAVPVLAAIAFGLALLREWRGSLVAPMLLHGGSNAVALLLARVVL